MPRLVRALLLTAVATVLLAQGAAAQTTAPLVVELSVDGVVDPFVASAVEDGIQDARGADAVLLRIDTPGGLDSSMRSIIQAVLNSPVPVICYVAPQGARAASAGAFILISCPVAAMAPGTNVGAATPVGLSGATASKKALEDSVAYIRSLAEQRDRNADWAESAVRDAASLPAEEALAEDVIDLVAPSRAALMNEIDGRSVEVADGQTVILETAGAVIEERGLGPIQAFLHALLDPNLAFIFFWLGLALIVIEFLAPGIGVAGIAGGLLLLTSLISFGMLPVQLAGVILLVAAAGLFIVELHAPGFGVAGAGGLIALIVGGLFLFDRSVPNATVSIWVILPTALLVAAFFTWVARAVLRLHRQPVAASGMERLVGKQGRAIETLDPDGFVWVEGEEWKASSTDAEPIPADTRIRVTAIEGVRLKVEPATAADETVVAPGTPGTEGGSTR